MPNPKSVKRAAGFITSRPVAAAKVPPEYPKYFVVQVADKPAEDLLRKRLKVLGPMPGGPNALRIESQMVRWTVMSNSNPPC